MRYLLMMLVVAAVMVVSSQDAAAQRGRLFGGRAFGGPGYGYQNQLRLSPDNPYSIYFSHPYPHHYGRWDLYFDMHGAPRGLRALRY